MHDPVELMARAAFNSLSGDVHNTEWEDFKGPINVGEDFRNRYRVMMREAIGALETAGFAVVRIAPSDFEKIDGFREGLSVAEAWKELLPRFRRDIP